MIVAAVFVAGLLAVELRLAPLAVQLDTSARVVMVGDSSLTEVLSLPAVLKIACAFLCHLAARIVAQVVVLVLVPLVVDFVVMLLARHPAEACNLSCGLLC